MTTSGRQAAPGPSAGGPGRGAGRLGGRAVLAVVGAFLVAGPLALLIVLVLTKSPGLRRFDQRIEQSVHAYVVERPALEDALRVGSAALHPRVMWLVVGVTAFALWRRGLHRQAVWAVVTIAVGASIDTPVKELIARARPVFNDPVATAPGYSFPSGHALNTMVVGAGRGGLGRARSCWAGTRPAAGPGAAPRCSRAPPRWFCSPDSTAWVSGSTTSVTWSG